MKKNDLTLPYLSSFCMSMYLVMQAGIPLDEGTRMLAEDEKDPGRRSLLEKLSGELELGESLGAAMEKTGAFPKYVRDMVNLGECTGNLDRVLKSLSEYYDRQEQISKSIKNAIMYPAILLVVMILVVVILITRVLPVFGEVYRQLGSEMSPTAAAIMNFGAALSAHWQIPTLVLAVLATAVLVCVFVKPVHAVLSNFISRRHSDQSIGAMVAYTRFASAMAMTMSSGMDVDESLEMAANLTGNPAVSERIRLCRERMAQGENFEDAISASRVLPALYCRMLTIGIRTGAADTVMTEIARRTEEQANDRIESAVSKVEPTLVIIMSVIVGLILLSVMLPLVNVMSAIG